MDEELKQRVTGYLDALEGSVAKAGMFVTEQAPIAVQEFLAWTFWESLILGLLCIAGVIGVVLTESQWLLPFIKKCEDPTDRSMCTFLSIVGSIGLVTILSVGGAANVLDAVKVSVAPRVVILEKVASLRK